MSVILPENADNYSSGHVVDPFFKTSTPSHEKSSGAVRLRQSPDDFSIKTQTDCELYEPSAGLVSA